MSRFLTVDEVIALHAATMRDMGHAPAPLRDLGLLESAVLKPQTAAHYEDADVIRQAAVLVIGISQNQPFIDGNKRTGYIAAMVLLRVNGHPFIGDRMEFARQLEAVAERTDSLDAATDRFEAWLHEYVP